MILPPLSLNQALGRFQAMILKPFDWGYGMVIPYLGGPGNYIY